MAWTGDWYIDMKGIKIEVLSISGTNITFFETKYNINGGTYNNTCEYDITTSNGRYYHYYFVPSNLSVGDLVPFPPVDIEHVGPLLISRTEQRSYSGANRTVDIAEFNYTSEYFGDTMNFYESYCWDQKTGFLLELTARTLIPSMGHLTSTGGLIVEETSLWSSKNYDPPLQLMALRAIIGVASVITVGMVILKKDKIGGESEENGSK